MSGLRTQSWAEAFTKVGIQVTVFTRDWEYVKDIKAGEHMDTTGYKAYSTAPSENLKVIYLPFKKSWEPEAGILKKFLNSFLALTGRYSAEADITQWHEAIVDEHKKEPFTHFITSSHPFSSLILMHRLQKQFSHCVTLVDFRDYININLLNPSVKFSLFSKLIIKAQQKWITHYAKHINHITTASESISEKFELVHRCKNVTTIYNGFETGLFDQVKETKENNVFHVSLIGTLYSYQDIDFMLNGLLGFFEQFSAGNDIMVNFIGVDYYPAVSKQISDKLAGYQNSFKITGRIERSNAISTMKNSEVLFYVGWKGWKGIYSGKIFEYLGAKRNILIAPNDGDVLEKLINYTNTGKLADTPEEMTSILSSWHKQWKNHEMEYHGIDTRINEFTRESQAEKVLQLITSCTKNKI
jgi:hypothetical protein